MSESLAATVVQDSPHARARRSRTVGGLWWWAIPMLVMAAEVIAVSAAAVLSPEVVAPFSEPGNADFESLIGPIG